MLETLYLKGTTSGLASGIASKNIQPFFGTEQHSDLLTWFTQFVGASNVQISNIVWDGDDLRKESYTYLLYALKNIFTEATLNACRLQPNNSLKKKFETELNATYHVIYAPNTKKKKKYVDLGIRTMKKFDTGAIVVIGGGPVVFQEFVESLNLDFPLIWYCFETNGWSSIIKEEQSGNRVFSRPGICATDIVHKSLKGRRYYINPK